MLISTVSVKPLPRAEFVVLRTNFKPNLSAEIEIPPLKHVFEIKLAETLVKAPEVGDVKYFPVNKVYSVFVIEPESSTSNAFKTSLSKLSILIMFVAVKPLSK